MHDLNHPSVIAWSLSLGNEEWMLEGKIIGERIPETMANEELTSVLKKYITSVVHAVNESGDQNVYQYFFSRSYNNGCGGHPDLAQHTEIAAELTKYIKQLKGW